MSNNIDYNKEHRKRLRKKFREGGIEAMHDYELLELLLTFSISRRDVKKEAKELIAYFGSLENVFLAPYEQLESITGIGEISSTLIRLVGGIYKFIAIERMNGQRKISGSEDACDYFKNLFAYEEVEKIAVMCLDNSGRIITCRVISEGISNFVTVNARKLINIAVSHNAASKVIIAHNHPRGEAIPSLEDINFTVEIKNLLSQMNIGVRDHVIVGESMAFSMRSSPEFKSYFNCE